MANIKRRIGSILGPEGRVPQIVEGPTTQLRPGEPARVDLIKIGDAKYRVEAQVPRGLDGDPTAVANFGEAMAAEVNTFESTGRAALNGAVESEMGVALTGQPLDFPRLQSAADRAASSGKRLWAAGEITTDQTLYLKSDADLGQLTINYTGTGTAVQLGKVTENLFGTVGTLPRIIHPGRDWSRDVVGAAFVNVYSSIWTVPHVEGFTVGMDVVGDGSGNVYNTYTIGHLYANQVNQRLRGINDGWSNQNTYIGGRYSHLSSQGVSVPGSRHIEMTVSSHGVNSNVWINPSVEGDTAEYHIYFSGAYNIVLNGRYEASNRSVYFANGSSWNSILYGYAAETLNEINDGSASNTIETNVTSRKLGGALTANIIMQQGSASGINDVILQPGDKPTLANIQERYRVKRTANETVMKRDTDEHPRLVLDHTNGLVQFGSGAAPVTMGLRSYGANVINAIGMPTNNTPNNTTTPAQWLEIRVDGVQSFIPLYR